MATTLAEIRAKLQATENRGAGNKQSGGDNAIYPHWNIAEGSTARLRFLPDGNTKNSFFWAERAMIRLPFNGIKGQSDSKPIVVQVPCMEMYGAACPILAEVRPWFKDPSLEEMGRKYWKKKSYVFQGFVRENALSDDKTPANPIRRFTISPQIFNIIKAALMDPEMESLFTDTESGTDFRLTKTTKGQYADYTTSSFARRERSLNEVERAAIEQFGLFNLNDFMPKKPSKEEVDIIYDMFKASVDGELYDPQRWGQYFKPAGVNLGNLGVAADVDAAESSFKAPAPVARPATVAKPTVVADDEDDGPPFDTGTAPAPKKNVEDILSMIRNRQK